MSQVSCWLWLRQLDPYPLVTGATACMHPPLLSSICQPSTKLPISSVDQWNAGLLRNGTTVMVNSHTSGRSKDYGYLPQPQAAPSVVRQVFYIYSFISSHVERPTERFFRSSRRYSSILFKQRLWESLFTMLSMSSWDHQCWKRCSNLGHWLTDSSNLNPGGVTPNTSKFAVLFPLLTATSPADRAVREIALVNLRIENDALPPLQLSTSKPQIRLSLSVDVKPLFSAPHYTTLTEKRHPKPQEDGITNSI